jgi:SAM-dependent methyltransferase
VSYALRLSDDEVVRYRMMADRARAEEAELWERAGLCPGARVADVGCGPGAMVAALAAVVGPRGRVIGVDGDPEAVRRATTLLADVPNARVRVGRADRTGLPAAGFDTVVLRHVLAHNGGAEQRIVDHLAELVRPGGHVLLVDVDLISLAGRLPTPELAEMARVYLRWHADLGNDLGVGRRLGDLARAAGLHVELVQELATAPAVSSRVRGPIWAARHELRRAGLVSESDLARWDAAFEEVGSRPQGITVPLTIFAAVARRPAL